MDAPADLTRLLEQWSRGDARALDALAEAVYPDLKRIAAARLRGERRGSLQATALVNEAFLRLMKIERLAWKSREQLYALATILMRRILVDRARARDGPRRGGGLVAVTLHDHHLVAEAPALPVAQVDGALAKLQALYPRKARIVELRCLGGMSLDEIAVALATSKSTVEREWRFAAAWLRRELAGEP